MLSSLQYFCPHLSIKHKPLSAVSRYYCNHFTGKPNPSLLKLRLAVKPKCAASDEQNQVEWAKGLETEFIPKHVAVIMDGNRRWAQNRGLPLQSGHREGGEVLKRLITSCKTYGVRVLSVFAFSTENWGRPEEEVDDLMDLFEETNVSDAKEVLGENTRVVVVGNRSQLRGGLQRLISAVEKITKDNKGLTLVMAINYGGRYDITEATRRIARKVEEGALEVEDICDDVLEQHLDTNGIEFPNPELLIRTSGEMRVSNFMLWQLAYAHMFFTDKLFPDFKEADLVRAFTAFQQARKRD